MELVSSRNVDDVVSFLKKELQKTHEGEYEKVWAGEIPPAEGAFLRFLARLFINSNSL